MYCLYVTIYNRLNIDIFADIANFPKCERIRLMKKFLTFFLAITVVFSMTAMFTTVGASGVDAKGIPYIDYLDFSSSKNQWAEKDDNDPEKYKYTSFVTADLLPDANGTPKYFPHALYHSGSGLEYEFLQDNNEVIRLTAKDTNNPYIAFEVDKLGSYSAGSENNGKMEYVKIRFKNNSPSTKLTFMGSDIYKGTNSLDSRATATIDIEPNSSEWQTITISMVEGTMNSRNNSDAGKSTWFANLKSFAIYPFGYNKDNEAIVNDKYYMEIDYVVLGSKDYVDSYQSELEKKELAAESFDWVTKPAKTEYFLGENIDLTGFEANIKYVEGSGYSDMVANGNSVSAVYNFDKPDDATPDAKSWKSTITLKYGVHELKYDVTVYDIEKIEFEYETDEATDVTNKVYDRVAILQAGDFTPTGIKVKVTYAKNDKDGKPITAIKEMYEVTLDGTDFSETVELTNGYYEYLVTITYYTATPLYLPVKLIEVSELVVTPVADKADKIYYGTPIDSSYFDIVCKYTNGDTKPLADSGLTSYLSVSGNTKTTGGETPITLKLENSAYDVHVNTVYNVTVQTPTDISVKLPSGITYNVDKSIPANDFTVKYTYAGGHTETIDKDDPNLVFNYDTSAPGENLKGVVKIGNKSAEFTYTVNEAKFKVDPLVRDGSKVELLASKIPTSLIVSLVCLAVVLVLVGGWALLKFVFKVDFKRKKRVSLDDIF